MEKTASDLLFEEYLKERRFTWEYEQPTGATQPDYLVHTSQADIVCEVKGFAWNEDDDRILASPGGVDPYTRIRKKVNRAREQFRPYKDKKMPCVLVLHNDASLTITLDALHIYAALFGDLKFSVELREPYNTTPFIDAANAMLRHNKNTTISAVAVLERFHIHQHLLDAAAASVSAPVEGPNDTRDLVRRLTEAFEKVERDNPDLDFEETVPRVRIMKNPHAAVSLPDGVFQGPHDGPLTIEETEDPA